MSIKKTIQIEDPRLKAENESVTDFSDPEVKRVIQDLIETMRHLGLIGLAAPQIGDNYKIFITEPRATQYRTSDQTDELRIYINPIVVSKSDEEVIIYEGCGSVSDADGFGPVQRSKEVTVEAFDENGKKFQFKSDGILARVIMHELDHLDGLEFLDRMEDRT